MLSRLLLGLLRVLVTRLELRGRGKKVTAFLRHCANACIRLLHISAHTTSTKIGEMMARAGTQVSPGTRF